MIFEIDAKKSWELMSKLKSYHLYKDMFSKIDVLRLLNEGTSSDDIIRKIVEVKLKEISKNED